MTSTKRGNDNNLRNEDSKKRRNKPSKHAGSKTKQLRDKVLPVLAEKHVRDMIVGSKGFYGHHFRTSMKIPYVLPFDRTKLVCLCGKQFAQKCGRSFYNHCQKCAHAKTCLNDYTKGSASTNEHLQTFPDGVVKTEDNLYTYLLNQEEAISVIEPGSSDVETLPRFLSIRGNLCLQSSKRFPLVACICGHHEPFHKIYGNHMVHCKYMYNMITKHAPTTRSLEKDCYSNRTCLVEYSSKNPNKENKLTFNDKKKKNGMRCFSMCTPLQYNSFRFYRPDAKQQYNSMDMSMTQLKALESYGRDLELIVINNFDEVAELLDKSTNRANCRSYGNDLCEIELILDENPTLSPTTSLLQIFCDKYNYHHEHFRSMLNFAKYTTMHDVGKKEFQNGQMSTPILTFNRQNISQDIRISKTMNDSRHYGMILSYGGTSVVVHKPIERKVIDSIEKFSKEVITGICGTECGVAESTDALMALIRELPSTSTTQKKVMEGCGNLFSPLVSESSSVKETDKYDLLKVRECLPGSFHSMMDGIIHSISQCTLDRVEIHLRWIFTPNTATPILRHQIYETKFTMMIHLASDIWYVTKTSDKNDKTVIKARTQILQLMCHERIYSNYNINNDIPEEYINCKIVTFLTEVDRVLEHRNKRDKFHCNEMVLLCLQYASMEDVFVSSFM